VTFIAVVNKSTNVSDHDTSAMVRACSRQLHRDAAPAWGLQPVPVVFYKDEEAVPPGAWLMALLDDADQADTLGWHTEEQGELIYGRVFTNPVLENGGSALSGALSVSSVLSHEVLEIYGDPRVNMWADNGYGLLYPLELCDPVESDFYQIELRGYEDGISVSNFVLPDWFDAYASGPYDYLKRLVAPFTMTDGGYVLYMQGGKINTKFGDKFPDWRKDSKRSELARTARRLQKDIK
jgi:hypothetical protein